MTIKDRYDVAVIGGGPSGSSIAYHAAKLGMEPILFEKKSYPREKPCGGALSARCIPLLGPRARGVINSEIEELTVYAPSYSSFTCRGIPGYFVTRAEFDEALALDALDAGAVLLDNCPVTGIKPLSPNGYEIHGTLDGKPWTTTADYVVLAAGMQDNSLMKQLTISRPKESDYLALCVTSETPIDHRIPANRIFSKTVLGIFFGVVANGYGWYFVKKGYLNLGIGCTAELYKDRKPMVVYNDFVDRLKEMGLIPGDLVLSKPRPFPLPFKHTVSQTVYNHVLLVGDMAGFVSPVTGEGLYYGIKSGELAAEAIYRNRKDGIPLSSYRENWERLFGDDLNKAGYFLHRNLYKSKQRMEIAVRLGRSDHKMAVIINKMVFGVHPYGTILKKALVRLPITLMRLAFPYFL